MNRKTLPLGPSHVPFSPTQVRVLATLALLLLTVALSPAQAQTLDASFKSATGWVKPGDGYPFLLDYQAGSSGAVSAQITVDIPPGAEFVSASQTPSSLSPLTFDLGALAPNQSGRIVVQARALDLSEDPQIVWKALSASAVFDDGSTAVASQTLGPKVVPPSGEYDTARYGHRPFPLIMVEYQDIQHCDPVDFPADCESKHTATALDEAVNSRTNGSSLWQLYNEMSFGQLQPDGQVRPPAGSTTEPWAATPTYPYKWSSYEPSGTCTSVTPVDPQGNPGTTPGAAPLNSNRIDDGWYVLPRDQAYYGADATGHGLVGFVSGGLLLNIDDACGPTGKMAYDAAAIADPDLDYNDFDTDKDGLVDFLNVAFAGQGGNGNTGRTGINNVWPHKSDLQFYFTDENGEQGYVSNDQLKSHTGVPMFWTDASRETMTTTNTGIPVYVRVGPYNVNPESAIQAMSVIAHEYGHSLGLPDFYSLGSRETFGTWELMASDHAQFMTVFNRQEMGWIVPQPVEDGFPTLRESKTDTGEIHWIDGNGNPYTLTGDGIHNADALKVDLPRVLVIDEVPSGVRAWHSGAGNEFGCSPEAGHNLDVFLPELKNAAPGSSIELSFESLYEIEWDWDFAFLLASTDGINWQALPSLENTTLDEFNPNGWECYDRYGHGITGVSRSDLSQRNLLSNPDRFAGTYREAQWIRDRFDLSAFAGDDLVVRLTYFTDPAVAKRGWFIDDLDVTVDGASIYQTDFEDEEGERLFSTGWSWVSTSTGADTDHAYFIEMRDRLSFDFDGKLQSERGLPTWQPGVAVLYTNENHGYGNTGVDNPPAQTIVDSQPQPGNDTPNLDDAAFRPEIGRDLFDACNHFDNYDNPAGGEANDYWKLPAGIRMTVAAFRDVSDPSNSGGIAPGTGEADLIVDAYPDCSDTSEPPSLAFGAGHEDPDPNGSYELTWTRPANAVGPDVLQEATLLATLLSDDAESGMTNWVASQSNNCDDVRPGDFTPWSAVPSEPFKAHSPTSSFFSAASEQASDFPDRGGCAPYSSTMTLSASISLSSDAATTLTFWDSFAGELDDLGFVEVSADNGASWSSVYQTAGPVFADETATFLEEPLGFRQIDLTAFAGSDILVRFRYTTGASNYIAYAPIGWWVDDIQIETANWYDVTETADTSYVRSGLSDGTYYYRVKTRFPGAPVGVDSPWSNVIHTDVVRVNNAPNAVDDSASTDQNQSVVIDVLANDSDPDGDPISVVSVGSALNGTATLNTDGTVTYQPNSGFSGNDAFSYTIEDNQGGSDSATVFVAVAANGVPVAQNDSASTDEGQAVNIDVLANDSDPDGDPLTVASTSSAANGAVTIEADGTVTYSPNAGFIGNDAFTYTVSDGRGGSATASVSVTVNDTNRAPAAVNDSAETDEDMPVVIDVLANDSDPDGDPLTVASVSTPGNGSATINSDGTVTYQPNPGFFGTDAFTYTIEDGRGGVDHATVSVNVIATGGSDTDSDTDSDSDPDSDSDSDSAGNKHKKSKNKKQSGPNTSQSYAMRVPDDALTVIAIIESAQAEALTLELRDPSGAVLGTAVGVGGQGLVTAVPLSGGVYSVTVTNGTGSAVDYDLTLISQVPGL